MKRRRLFRLPWRTPRQIRADVDEELRFHLDMRVDELVALGANPDAARAQSMREFGDLDDARRYIGAVDRDIEAAQRRSDFMNDLRQDIGYALRKLRSTPAFTLAAVITLALGIGANTAIFSVVNRVLLQPLPFPQPDRLMRLRFTQQGQPDAGTPMDLVDYRTQAKSFTGIAAMEGTTANLTRETGDAERVTAVRVSDNWFDLLRVKPVAGRFFLPGEDKVGGPKLAVISEELWRRDFAGDPGIVGKPLRINAQSFTVVGIVAAQQHYPITAEIWMLKQFDAQELSDDSRGARWLGYLARVKDDANIDAAGKEVLRISEMMEKRFPEMLRERRASIRPVKDALVGDMRKPLYVMLGAVVLVLLIACANVANLLLVRAASRESEMAIRTALGAGRGRLTRQLITESVILAIIGGAAGLGVAKLGMWRLLAMAPQNLVFVDKSTIDTRALVLTALVAIVTGLIFGALPALQVTRTELAAALRAGGRGARNRPLAHRTKNIIVVGELALAVMLLSGAGLLLHSFSKLTSIDPGFRPEGVISMKLALPRAAYDSEASRTFVRELESKVHALPGVQTVGIANMIPLDGGSYNFTFSVRGVTYARPSDEPSSEIRQVTPDYFRAMGMTVLRGRGIEPTDVPGAPRVYVVNQAFAKKFFTGKDAVRQAIRVGWGRDPKELQNEIVGVVSDVRGNALGEEPEPTVYASFAQYPDNGLSIVARSAVPPASLATPIRAIVRAMNREVPVYSVQTMEERVATSVGTQRFYATLIGVFAAVALVLAAVGLYGVIAYAVSQRTHELGVRVALGATTDRISAMVIGEGMKLTAVGLALGIAASLGLGRIVATLLYGISPRDPITLVAVLAALAVVATLASWLPARRAARVDPFVAMRGD
jgi:putative ABC transport system permease protein